MQYRRLGRTGVEVSTQCLGAMMFGEMGNKDHDACVSLIHRALDAGINFIDTADVYSQGESEEIVAKAIAGSRRDDLVLATKCWNQMGRERNQRGGSRRWIARAVEGSLRRLGTDHIDLYQMHRHDWDVDLEVTLSALTDLVRQGKVRYIGSSTFPAELIVEAQWAADRRNLERFMCEQPQYSIFARSIEEAVLPTCQRHGMGVIPWSPLAGGWLTGKYRRDAELPADSRYGPGGMFAARDGRNPLQSRSAEVRFGLIDELTAVAEAAGITLTHLAIAFVDAHPAVSSVIIGPRTMEQLEGVLGAADISLDADTLDAIDKVVRPGTDVAGTAHYAPNPHMDAPARRR